MHPAAICRGWRRSGAGTATADAIRGAPRDQSAVAPGPEIQETAHGGRYGNRIRSIRLHRGGLRVRGRDRRHAAVGGPAHDGPAPGGGAGGPELLVEDPTGLREDPLRPEVHVAEPRDRPGAGAERTDVPAPARKGDRRLQLDQRAGPRARRAAGLRHLGEAGRGRVGIPGRVALLQEVRARPPGCGPLPRRRRPDRDRAGEMEEPARGRIHRDGREPGDPAQRGLQRRSHGGHRLLGPYDVERAQVVDLAHLHRAEPAPAEPARAERSVRDEGRVLGPRGDRRGLRAGREDAPCPRESRGDPERRRSPDAAASSALRDRSGGRCCSDSGSRWCTS